MKKSAIPALILVILVAGPLKAQEGASLAEVEALAAAGRILEARETLETWWTTHFSTASRSRRQQGIWLRGKLTVDPAMAEMDFRRLVLEFPGGAYSDDALVRLALSADLRGDPREAAAFFRRLLDEYPASPRLPEAEAWLGAHRLQLEALPPAAVEPESPGPATGAEGASGEGDFAVQVGAFRSLDRARSLARRLEEEGYAARLVRTPGNDLAKVRLGRFSIRPSAQAFARELGALGYEVTLVSDAGREEKVGTTTPPEES